MRMHRRACAPRLRAIAKMPPGSAPVCVLWGWLMALDARRRAQALLDGVPIPMLAVDGHARMIAANPAARALFGEDL
ncbi:MAG: PAS domain-containing protein, partial [Paracoccus sp. (in: a-proteobacteria)]